MAYLNIDFLSVAYRCICYYLPAFYSLQLFLLERSKSIFWQECVLNFIDLENASGGKITIDLFK